MAPMILTISADPNIKPAKDKMKKKSADHLHPLKLQKDKTNSNKIHLIQVNPEILEEKHPTVIN